MAVCWPVISSRRLCSCSPVNFNWSDGVKEQVWFCLSFVYLFRITCSALHNLSGPPVRRAAVRSKSSPNTSSNFAFLYSLTWNGAT